jgi:hypothetical protein
VLGGMLGGDVPARADRRDRGRLADGRRAPRGGEIDVNPLLVTPSAPSRSTGLIGPEGARMSDASCTRPAARRVDHPEPAREAERA